MDRSNWFLAVFLLCSLIALGVIITLNVKCGIACEAAGYRGYKITGLADDACSCFEPPPSPPSIPTPTWKADGCRVQVRCYIYEVEPVGVSVDVAPLCWLSCGPMTNQVPCTWMTADRITYRQYRIHDSEKP